MNIAIFDSGIGGLTVLKEALKILPDENYIYYADTENAPYGTKPKEAVLGYLMDAAGFLAGQGIKMLVIACNTATSAGVQELRKTYSIPIVGMEPAVKPALLEGKDKRVLVMATTLTLKEEKLQNLISRIDGGRLIDRLPMDRLVGYAERFDFESPEVKNLLKEKFRSLDMDRYGCIVLGCTHFIFYRKIIEEIVPGNIRIIDGNTGTVRNMKSILESGRLLAVGKGGKVIFYNSGKPETNPERIEKYKSILDPA